MGGQWEVMWGLWGSWEVSEGSWEVSGGSWEVSEWSWEVSGRLKGGHGRSPGGYKMLIANAIAEQRLYPSFFGSDIWVKSESNEDQKSAYSRQSGFRDKNAYLFHWSMEKKISYSTLCCNKATHINIHEYFFTCLQFMYWHMKVKKCFFTVHSYFKITLLAKDSDVWQKSVI